MIRYSKRAGGPERVRRLLVIAALSLVMPAITRADSDEAGGPSNVTVRGDRGVYVVAAGFRVPYPSQVAMAVLTDYDGIARFMPDIEKSVVLERANDRAIVEQEAVSRVMMFSKRIHLELEITQDSDSIHFRDRSGRSFDRYEGSWRLVERAGMTEIHYELTARPSFDVPQFLLKRLLKRNSAVMIEQLQTEIARRSR